MAIQNQCTGSRPDLPDRCHLNRIHHEPETGQENVAAAARATTAARLVAAATERNRNRSRSGKGKVVAGNRRSAPFRKLRGRSIVSPRLTEESNSPTHAGLDPEARQDFIFAMLNHLSLFISARRISQISSSPGCPINSSGASNSARSFPGMVCPFRMIGKGTCCMRFSRHRP